MVADHIFVEKSSHTAPLSLQLKSRTPALEEGTIIHVFVIYLLEAVLLATVNICLPLSKSPAVIDYNSDAPIANSREESQRTIETLSYHDDLIKYVSFLFMLRELRVQCNNQLLHRGVRKFVKYLVPY